jgi:hypothetical protein
MPDVVSMPTRQPNLHGAIRAAAAQAARQGTASVLALLHLRGSALHQPKQFTRPDHINHIHH